MISWISPISATLLSADATIAEAGLPAPWGSGSAALQVGWLALGLAMLAVVIGTDRLGRPFTVAESKAFATLLREHDYVGARLRALHFAHRLTRSIGRAQDLVGRVDQRLIRLGWNPDEVSLDRYLCRLTWSEWTHAAEEHASATRTQEAYQRELEVHQGTMAPSAEAETLERAERQRTHDRARANLDALRASFESAGDAVNLLWLDELLKLDAGSPDLRKLASESGRDVREFYAAAKRRARAVLRLLAKQRGVEFEE